MTDTLPRVAPQPRGIVPPAHLERVLAALQGEKDADAELVAAVAAALNAGGSVRELIALTGMSSARVQRLGHKGGWPTEEAKAERTEVRRKNAEWRAFIEQNPDGPPASE